MFRGMPSARDVTEADIPAGYSETCINVYTPPVFPRCRGRSDWFLFAGVDSFGRSAIELRSARAHPWKSQQSNETKSRRLEDETLVFSSGNGGIDGRVDHARTGPGEGGP